MNEQLLRDYGDVTGFYLSSILEKLDHPEFDSQNFPFLSQALETAITQVPQLIQKIETDVTVFAAISRNETKRTSVEKSEEDVMEYVIEKLKYYFHSLGHVFEEYSSHPQLRYILKRKDDSRTELVPSIRILYTPVTLQNFGAVPNELLGTDKDTLKEYLQKTNTERKNIAKAVTRIDQTIRTCMKGWSKNLIQTTQEKGRVPGLIINFGRVTKSTRGPHSMFVPEDISVSIEIQHSQEEGLLLLPVLRFKKVGSQRGESNEFITCEGTPVPIQFDTQLVNPDTINQTITTEFDSLFG